MKLFRTARLAPCALLALFLVPGCGTSPPSDEGSIGIDPTDDEAQSQAEASVEFSASHLQVEYGERVRLSWTLPKAPDELLLDGVDVLGEDGADVLPERRQTFTLTVRFGSIVVNKHVTVAARGVALLGGSERGAGYRDGFANDARFQGVSDAAYDTSGNLYIADAGNCSIRKLGTDGQVATVAGTPLSCQARDGFGKEAGFRTPYHLAVADDGTIYVSDLQARAIRRVTPSGEVSTLAGALDQPGAVDGQGGAARFQSPSDMLLLPSGDLLVVDAGNYAIRRVTPEGVVTTAYGILGSSGSDDAPTPTFSYPSSIARAADGTLYVADRCRVRRIALNGTVSNFAGTSICDPYYSGLAQSRFGYIYGIAVTETGDVYLGDSGTDQLIRISGETVTVVAGKAGMDGDLVDGFGTQAKFGRIYGLTLAPDGNITLGDYFSGRVRGVSQDGLVSTLAGQITPYGSVDGPIGVSRFGQVQGLFVDADDSVVVADSSQNRIRRITPSGESTTLAGQGIAGTFDGPASDALFWWPSGVVGTDEGTYYVLDGAGLVRKLEAGTVTTFAGTVGLDGGVDGPPGVGALAGGGRGVVAGDGHLYVADSWGNAIRRILPNGTIELLAGSVDGGSGADDGKGPLARFNDPADIAVDDDGALLVLDAQNYTIRRVTLDGEVTTLAGVPGQMGPKDGPLGEGLLGYCQGIGRAPSGDLYIADTYSHTVRRLSKGGVLSTIAGRVGRPGISVGAFPGGLFEPRDVAVTSQGDLIVTTGAAVLQLTAP